VAGQVEGVIEPEEPALRPALASHHDGPREDDPVGAGDARREWLARDHAHDLHPTSVPRDRCERRDDEWAGRVGMPRPSTSLVLRLTQLPDSLGLGRMHGHDRRCGHCGLTGTEPGPAAWADQTLTRVITETDSGGLVPLARESP